MKAICDNDGYFIGGIPDVETYEKVKTGEADWKKHIKPKLKTVQIPYELFLHLMATDKKQTPKKVDVKRWIYTQCECGYEFSKHHGDGYYSIPYDKQTNYCPNCGQALDWGQEDE